MRCMYLNFTYVHRSAPSPTPLAEGCGVYGFQVCSICVSMSSLSAPSYLVDDLCQAADVNDFIPPRLHHWLSAVPVCLPSVIWVFSGRRCSYFEQSASTHHLLTLCSCLPVHLNTYLFSIS